MNKHILRKFHTSSTGERTRLPVKPDYEKVYSTIPHINFNRAKKMIVEWGYNLDEVLSYKDKQGRTFQTNFNQHQLIELKSLENAQKQLNVNKQQVKTIFRDKLSQLYSVINNNEKYIKNNSLHIEITSLFNQLTADKFQHNEIQQIFHCNKSLREFAY